MYNYPCLIHMFIPILISIMRWDHDVAFGKARVEKGGR